MSISDSQNKCKPIWIRGSAILQASWITKEVLVWCSGTHIIFFNVNKSEQIIQHCSNHENGEGASCISTHPATSVYAFAEKSLSPRILVHVYPSLQKISECNALRTPEIYLSIAFSGDEYLVSLSSYPEFLVTVWVWRNGTKVVTMKSCIRDDFQSLKALVHDDQPELAVAQLSPKSGKIHVWEMTSASKFDTPILEHHEIVLPKNSLAQSVDWCSEKNTTPFLAIVDNHNHVFLSNLDGSEVQRIILSQHCGECSEIEKPFIIFFRTGILFKTNFCQIRFYEQIGNVWKQICELLFFFTQEGHLMKINHSEDKPSAEQWASFGTRCSFLEFVYPQCKYLLTSDNNRDVCILDAETGREIDRFKIFTGFLTDLISNLYYPFIIVTSDRGEFAVLDFSDISRSQILCNYRLQESRIDFLKFSQCGRYVVAVDKKQGRCFTINLLRSEKTPQIALLQETKEISDVILYNKKNFLELYILPNSLKEFSAGNELLLYTLCPMEKQFKKSHIILKLENHFKNVISMPRSLENVYGTPILSRKIQFFKKEVEEMKLKNEFYHDHQVRCIGIYADENWITTSGKDGYSIVRNIENTEKLLTIMSHHWKDSGVLKAIVNPFGNSIFCLGYDGSIVAMKADNIVTEKTFTNKKNDNLWENVILSDFPRFSDNDNETWFDFLKRQEMEEESLTFSEEKTKIRRNLRLILEKVTVMLVENENCPENERLNLPEFDLDKVLREEKIRAAKSSAKKMVQDLHKKCEAMDKVSSWIEENLWKTQKVLGQSVLQVFGERQVTNYPLSVSDFEVPEKLLNNEFLRNFDNNEENDARRENIFMSQKFSGTTIRRFIEDHLELYPQYQLYSYAQKCLDQKTISANRKKLRLNFNKSCEEMLIIKERSLSLLNEYIDRLEFIDSEMKSMFGYGVPNLPRRPKWNSKEKPENIIRVEDSEINAKPEEDLNNLEENGTLENKNFFGALDEFFRERALVSMMHGVLEMSWEVAIKRDVERPHFMVEKNPEDFTEDELKAVAEYESEVENLRLEREKYRKILGEDCEKVKKAFEESVKKFNSQHEEFFQSKLRVESAIQQLNLRFTRGQLRHFHRLQSLNTDSTIYKSISFNRLATQNLTSQLLNLKNIYEQSKTQKIALESDFKTMTTELKDRLSPTLTKKTFNVLLKLYKKEPTIHFRNASHVLELEKIIANPEEVPFLTLEALEYLKILEGWDSRPHDLPSNVDANTWANFVALRRLKIQASLRIQGHQLHLTELQKTINYYEYKIANHDKTIKLKIEQKSQLKKSQDEWDLNIEGQLILKMGQVESELPLFQKDSVKLILIPTELINSINKTVKTTGSEKIKAMKHMARITQETSYIKWRCMFSKIKIQNLQFEISQVRKFPVPKDMMNKLDKIGPIFLVELKTNNDKKLKIMAKHSEKRLENSNKNLEILKKQTLKIKKLKEERCKEILEYDPVFWDHKDFVVENEKIRKRKFDILQHWCGVTRKIQENYREIDRISEELELVKSLRNKFFHCVRNEGSGSGN